MRLPLTVPCHIGCEPNPSPGVQPRTMVEDAPGSPPQSLVREPKNQLRRAKSGKAEFAECRKFARAVAREFFRGDDRAPEPAGQLFDARGKIDGGTDAGEIEPIAAADIAVEH